MKTWIIAIGLFSLVSSAWADELEDSYASLKTAVEKKEADTVRKLAADVAKMARTAAAAPATSDEAKQHADFAKDVLTYTEYSLAATATAQGMEPSKTVELIDQLEAENPKSKYLDRGTTVAYINALESLASGSATKAPDRALTYANKLVNVMKAKPKPEGVSDADWERARSEALGTGYFIAGAVNQQKGVWVDCDRDLKNALGYISKDPGKLGPAEFMLGVCNYQLGRLTADRSRLMAAQKYSEESAAISGPSQAQAAKNALAIKAELAGPAKR